jgi:hypothetical protein
VLAFAQLHGDLAVAVDALEVAELVAADIAGGGGEHDVQPVPGRLVLRQGEDGGDGLALSRGKRFSKNLPLEVGKPRGRRQTFSL